MRNATVSIIVVTYNAENYITQCLSSISKYNKKKSEVIIVDNNSSDNTLSLVNSNAIPINVIKNKKNKGFAHACNQGARLAKGDTLIFINPDTMLLTSYSPLVIELSKKSVGVVGCSVQNTDKSIQPSCGNFPTLLNLMASEIAVLRKLQKPYLLQQKRYYRNIQNPDWVSGVCFAISKDLFEKLGGFDTDYFMYGEDVDLCYRATKAGFTVKYVPKVKIIHLDIGKSDERKYNKFINLRKGLLIFMQKHTNQLSYFSLKVIFFAESLLRIAIFPFYGEDIVWVKTYKLMINEIKQ